MDKHLVVMAVIRDDVHGLDDVAMLERRSDTELGSDLLLILLFALARSLGTELLDGVDATTHLRIALDETNSASCAATEDSAPLAVLLG